MREAKEQEQAGKSGQGKGSAVNELVSCQALKDRVKELEA